MPTVTVLMSVKNGETTIQRCVKSILNQTFQDFEFIIVDDYSNDYTTHILNNFKEDRLKLMKAPKPGLVNALNYGLAQAKGKYIARIDADDVAKPNRLELQVNLLDNEPKIGVVSSQINHVSTHNKQEGYAEHVNHINKVVSPHDHYLNRFKDAPLANPSAMFRKTVLSYGNYLDFDGPEDYEFWLRLLEHNIQFKKIEEILLDWYDYDSRLTRTNTNYSIDSFSKVKASYFAHWWKENNKQRELWIWGYGKDVFNKSKWLKEAGVIINGYLDIKERPNASRNVLKYDQIDLAKAFIVIYVSDRKGQQQINSWLTQQHVKPGDNFYFMT